MQSKPPLPRNLLAMFLGRFLAMFPGLMVLLPACSTKVDHISVPPEPIRIHDQLTIRLNVKALDSSGNQLMVPVSVLDSTNPSVVGIQDGKARCISSGSSVLALAADDARARITVLCRLVDHISPSPQSVDLLKGEISMAEVALEWQILDEHQQVIQGLDPQVLNMDAEIVEILPGPRLRPVNVGSTFVRLSTSGKSTDVPVRVGQLLGKIGLDTGGTLLLPRGSVELRTVGESAAKLHVPAGSDCRGRLKVPPEQPITCTQKQRVSATVDRRPGSRSRLLMVAWPPPPDEGDEPSPSPG